MTKFAQAASIFFTLFAFVASSSSNDHDVLAVSVPENSSKSKAKLAPRALSKRSKSSKGETKQGGSDGMRRFTMPVRTTLTGVDMIDDSILPRSAFLWKIRGCQPFRRSTATTRTDSLAAQAFSVEQEEDGKNKRPTVPESSVAILLPRTRTIAPSFLGLLPVLLLDHGLTLFGLCLSHLAISGAMAMIRQGPFERFQDVQECQVIFA